MDQISRSHPLYDLSLIHICRIKMRPAVELSYLNEDCQRDLVDEIDLNDCTPSHDQAIRMRKFFEEGKLTTEAISASMSEEKPNRREKIVLRGDRVRSLIPVSYTHLDVYKRQVGETIEVETPAGISHYHIVTISR